MILLLCAPAHTTSVDPTSLRGSHWLNAAEKGLPDTPCNYIYLDDKYSLLYYGTSVHCKTRDYEHSYEITKTGELMSVILSGMTSQDQIKLKNHLLETAMAVDNQHKSAQNFSSDMCLALVSQKSNISLWYLPTDDKAAGEGTEKCVLKKAIGYCNRRGDGSATAGWQATIGNIQKCMANPKAND